MFPELLKWIPAKSKLLLTDYKSESQWSTMCPCEDWGKIKSSETDERARNDDAEKYTNALLYRKHH